MQKINKKLIDEIVKSLKFYDINGFLPNQKIRIDITLSYECIKKLENVKNKSKFIEELINDRNRL